MEVGVRICSEDPMTGDRVHCLTGYLTFVGVDSDGKPAEIDPIAPETDDDKRREIAARARRQYRLMNRKI